VAVQPTEPKMAATVNPTFGGKTPAAHTNSIPADDNMPGKHVANATSEPCDRCKENLSVLIVRAKPLCQSV
jgi:hypothetical protein